MVFADTGGRRGDVEPWLVRRQTRPVARHAVHCRDWIYCGNDDRLGGDYRHSTAIQHEEVTSLSATIVISPMATLPASEIATSGSSMPVRNLGRMGSPAVDGLPMAKSPAIKRSWFTCIRCATPELRILFGLVLVVTALACGWMLQRGIEGPIAGGLRVPILLSLFAIIAFAPPLILNFRSSDPNWLFIAALLGIGWRSTFSTIALVYLMLSKAGQDFLLSSGLVACYFPLLVLQSWLLTRQAKRL